MTKRTPWAQMLAAARGMSLPPEAFWRLSLREWRALSAPLAEVTHMHRAAFEALSRLYPDKMK